MITLRHLRLVDAVAREGTLTAAAKRLFLTQPALSHQLADLERQVGSPVFHRVGKKLVPTALGVRLLRSATEVLGTLGELQSELPRYASGKKGTLRVTSQCYTCYHWLPGVLPDYLARHGDIDFTVVPEYANDSIEALLSGKVDLALTYEPQEQSPFAVFPLFEDEVVLVSAPDHPLAQRPYVEAADFADVHLLVHYHDPANSFFYRWLLTPNGVVPAKVSAVRLTEAIVALATAGVGCAVLPRWTVAPALAEGRLRATRLTELGLYRHWQAVALPGAETVPYFMDFVQLLQRGPARLFDDPGARGAKQTGLRAG